MKIKTTVMILALGAITIGGCSHHHHKKHKPKPEPVDSLTLSQVNLRNHIASWPEPSKVATEEMLSKYGLPQTISDDFLVWNESGIFKQSIVYREGIFHAFPTPHTDVLEQTIDYKVPTSKVDDLWAFDGSILLDRTKGEMSSRCDQESMNILALNLADEIVTNKLSINAARKEYQETARSVTAGNQPKFAAEFSFKPQGNMAADADKEVKAIVPTKRPLIQAQEARE